MVLFPASPFSPILGFHRDTEEAATVLEAASAETSPDISAKSCIGHAELPAAEGVGGHLPRPMECGMWVPKGVIVFWNGPPTILTEFLENQGVVQLKREK